MSIKKEKEIRSERTSFYCNLICGAFFSGMSIVCVIFVTFDQGIRSISNFIIGLTFLIIWLITCLSLIFYGIYIQNLEKKHPNKLRKKKDLKPPIVS
jgi:hypothetical protein